MRFAFGMATSLLHPADLWKFKLCLPSQMWYNDVPQEGQKTAMEVNKTLEGAKLTVAPVGRIDTLTAPELDGALALDGVEELVFDFADVSYISSAGLRVLLAALKRMEGRPVTVAHVSAAVREVFDITGFSALFTLTDAGPGDRA